MRCTSTRPRTCWAGWPTSIRLRKHPDRTVTYIIDRNVNYTNVCVAKCNFCAFYREVGSSDGYVLGFEEIFRKIDETIEVGGVQLLLQGGHNPDLPLTWYEDLFRAIKDRYPDFKLHALSPPEVIHLSRLSQLSVPEVIDRLIAAGLDSIPGGGAEILVDRVRRLLHCYGKATADEWLDVMRHAHRRGLRTTATMMYGTVETLEERIEHMMRLRDAAGRDRRLHRVHHLELPARSTRSLAAPRPPASTICARSRSRASCSTTSTTFRRRGSPRAERSGS